MMNDEYRNVECDISVGLTFLVSIVAPGTKHWIAKGKQKFGARIVFQNQLGSLQAGNVGDRGVSDMERFLGEV
jgi:hypothetical protein